MGFFGDIGGAFSAVAGVIAPFAPFAAGLAGAGGALTLLDGDPEELIMTPWPSRSARDFYNRGGLLWGLEPHPEDLKNDLYELRVQFNAAFLRVDVNPSTAAQQELIEEYNRRGKRSDRFSPGTPHLLKRRYVPGVWGLRLTPLRYQREIGSPPVYGSVGIKVARFNELVERFTAQGTAHVGPPIFWYLDLRPFEQWARDRWIEHAAHAGQYPPRYDEFEVWLARWDQSGLRAEWEDFHANELVRLEQDTADWHALRNAQAVEAQRQAQEAILLQQFNAAYADFVSNQSATVPVAQSAPQQQPASGSAPVSPAPAPLQPSPLVPSGIPNLWEVATGELQPPAGLVGPVNPDLSIIATSHSAMRLSPLVLLAAFAAVVMVVR